MGNLGKVDIRRWALGICCNGDPVFPCKMKLWLQLVQHLLVSFPQGWRRVMNRGKDQRSRGEFFRDIASNYHGFIRGFFWSGERGFVGGRKLGKFFVLLQP